MFVKTVFLILLTHRRVGVEAGAGNVRAEGAGKVRELRAGGGQHRQAAHIAQRQDHPSGQVTAAVRRFRRKRSFCGFTIKVVC